MTEFDQRMARLGEALEASAPPVSSDEARRRSADASTGPRTVARRPILPFAAAAAALLVVASGAAFAFTRAQDRVTEVTTTPPTTTPRSLSTPGPVAAVFHMEGTATTSARGIGVVADDKNETVLLDDRGTVVARGGAAPSLVSPETVLVASIHDDVMELRTDDALVPSRAGCLAGHDVGGVTVQRCGDPSYLPPRIEFVDRQGQVRTLIEQPPAPAGADGVLGGWRSAKLSPDGKTVLAQWSGECEVPTVFFIDVGSGSVSAANGDPGKPWNEAPAATSAGWRTDGKAVIATGEWGCGTSSTPGVYLVEPGKRPILLRAAERRPPGVFAWRMEGDVTEVRPACDPPVEAASMPAGWDAALKLGAAEDHPNGAAIGHWAGPRPRTDVITIVGADGGGVVGPSTTSPIATFTSMGNPASIFEVHEAYAAKVDPPNAPTGCSPLYLIGESVSASTLQAAAEGLRSRTAPAVVDISVAGTAVRGTRISMTATSPNWGRDREVEVEVGNIDGYGSSGYAGRIDAQGELTAALVVPTGFRYEGYCPGEPPCDIIGTKAGPMRVRIRVPEGRREILAEGEFEVVAGKQGVAYPSVLLRECGPPRVEIDGATWVTEDEEAYADEPGVDYPDGRIEGTFRRTGQTAATFRSTAGTLAPLKLSATGYAC